ncbi:DMT family transporter, partial [Aquamicrobium sp.]|uniref:DMT family transporter n=1 Tax=Aquamicrobium sp. TaxID=1872579 RepID=UPI0025900EE8
MAFHLAQAYLAGNAEQTSIFLICEGFWFCLIDPQISQGCSGKSALQQEGRRMSVSVNSAPSAAGSNWPALLALVTGALAMAVSPILVRLSDVGPFASAFYRVFLALPFLFAWMRIEQKRSKAPAPARRFSPAVIATGLAFAGDLFFWHLAILNTTIANSTFFATTAPLWVGLLGWIVLGRRVTAATAIGLVFCLAGGAALVWHSFELSPDHLLGDLFGALTGLFFGIYFLTVEKARETEGAAWITFHMSLITAALLALAA